MKDSARKPTQLSPIYHSRTIYELQNSVDDAPKLTMVRRIITNFA